MDVVEDYKRRVVLISPEVYNAGFIGVVSSEPRFKVPDDYVAFLRNSGDKWLRGVGAGAYVIVVFEQDEKSVTAVQLLDSKQRLSVGFLKKRGFRVEMGAPIHVRVVSVFSFGYLFEEFGLRRFVLEDVVDGRVEGRYALEIVGLGDGYLRVRVVDWRGGEGWYVDFVGLGFVDRYGVLFSVLGDGNKLVLFFDPEVSESPFELKFARAEDEVYRYLDVKKCAVVRYRPLGGGERIGFVVIYEVTHKGRSYLRAAAYYAAYEGNRYVFKPVESFRERDLLYFKSIYEEVEYGSLDLTNEYKKKIKEAESDKVREKWNRKHYCASLIESGYEDYQVFTSDALIPAKKGKGRQVDVLILEKKDKILTIVEMKCIFKIGESFSSFERTVRRKIWTAVEQLDSLKEWFEENDYVDSEKRLNRDGAEAIVKLVGKWSVDELVGLRLEFKIVISDSRLVLENPENDIYYFEVSIDGVTGIWKD